MIIVGVGGAAYGFTLLPSGMWGGGKASNFRELAATRGDVTWVVNSTGTVQPVLSVQVGSFVSGPIARDRSRFQLAREKRGHAGGDRPAAVQGQDRPGRGIALRTSKRSGCA